MITVVQGDRKNNVIIGGFYRRGDGSIVKTHGTPTVDTVAWVMDGKVFGTSTRDEMDTWEELKLRDFPNAKDPLLPYGFDLLWDCHTLGQFLAQYGDNRKVMKEGREMAKEYGIDLRKPDTVRAYNDGFYRG